jgi:hypothetical protein
MFQGLPSGYVVILPYNFIISNILLTLQCILWWSVQEGAIAWGESTFVTCLCDNLSDRQGRRTLGLYCDHMNWAVVCQVMVWSNGCSCILYFFQVAIQKLKDQDI